MSEEKELRNFTLCLEVVKVLSKSNSKIWGKFKEGDIIIASLPITYNSGYKGAKQVFANIYKNKIEATSELGKSSMTNLFSYIGPGSTLFELKEVSNSLITEVSTYCNELCLTKEPEFCKNCPLNKFNNL